MIEDHQEKQGQNPGDLKIAKDLSLSFFVQNGNLS